MPSIAGTQYLRTGRSTAASNRSHAPILGCSHPTNGLPLHNTCDLESSSVATRRKQLSAETAINGVGGPDKSLRGILTEPLACAGRKDMRVAALLVALFTIMVGILGIISPDSLTAVRRQYFATPLGFYAAGALRVVIGLLVILVARTSRAPKTLRALGAVMCMQGLAATLRGADRARAILEWETMQGNALLRVGAIVALAAGGFMAFAVSGRPPRCVE